MTTYNPDNPTYPSPKEWVYSLIHQHGEVTKGELVHKTGLSERTVERCLSKLESAEKIQTARDPREPRRHVFHPPK